MLHSRLRFLSSQKDECTGNGEPGAMGSCSATAGGLRLGSLGLESDALGSLSTLTRDRDNQLFRGLGHRRVRADTARGTLECLDLGDGRDSAVDGSLSRRRQLEEADRSSMTLCVRRTRARAHTAYERISSWGLLASPVLRRRGSLELRDRWRAPRELSPSLDSRYSYRTRYRHPTDSTDSSFDEEFGECCPFCRRGGLPLPRSTLGGLEKVPDRSACSRSLLVAFASKS
jgi:hypothetical protein